MSAPFLLLIRTHVQSLINAHHINVIKARYVTSGEAGDDVPYYQINAHFEGCTFETLLTIRKSDLPEDARYSIDALRESVTYLLSLRLAGLDEAEDGTIIRAPDRSIVEMDELLDQANGCITRRIAEALKEDK